MNKQRADILRRIIMEPFINQSVLANSTGYSIGVVNCSLKALIRDGYLDDNMCPTARARHEYNISVPKNAIILAAGLGMRMVPIEI